MPLPFIHSTTSLFGLAYTGFRGLVLAGQWNASTAPTGPLAPPAGLALVQPGAVCSTLGPAPQILSTLAASISGANFLYIPQTTGTIFVSASTVGTATPPLSGMGAAIVWDAGNKRLNIWSSVHEWVSQLSTVGGGYFSSS